MARWVKDPILALLEDAYLIPGLAQGYCKLGHSSQMCLGSGVAVLWYKPAAATLIRPLAWELQYHMQQVHLFKKKKKKTSRGAALRDPVFHWNKVVSKQIDVRKMAESDDCCA